MAKFESSTNGPDDDSEGIDNSEDGEILYISNVSKKALEFLGNEYNDLNQPIDSLRSAIFHFPEFRAMKQDEVDLAVKMFDYAIESIINPQEKSLESISQKDLVDITPTIARYIDLYDEKTANYVAGQVMSAIKRIISEQEKES